LLNAKKNIFGYGNTLNSQKPATIFITIQSISSFSNVFLFLF